MNARTVELIRVKFEKDLCRLVESSHLRSDLRFLAEDGLVFVPRLVIDNQKTEADEGSEALEAADDLVQLDQDESEFELVLDDRDPGPPPVSYSQVCRFLAVELKKHFGRNRRFTTAEVIAKLKAEGYGPFKNEHVSLALSTSKTLGVKVVKVGQIASGKRKVNLFRLRAK